MLPLEGIGIRAFDVQVRTDYDSDTRTATRLGARLCDHSDENISYLVVNDDVIGTGCHELLEASRQSPGAVRVSSRWLEQCEASKNKVDPSPYLLGPYTGVAAVLTGGTTAQKRILANNITSGGGSVQKELQTVACAESPSVTTHLVIVHRHSRCELEKAASRAGTINIVGSTWAEQRCIPGSYAGLENLHPCPPPLQPSIDHFTPAHATAASEDQDLEGDEDRQPNTKRQKTEPTPAADAMAQRGDSSISPTEDSDPYDHSKPAEPPLPDWFHGGAAVDTVSTTSYSSNSMGLALSETVPEPTQGDRGAPTQAARPQPTILDTNEKTTRQRAGATDHSEGSSAAHRDQAGKNNSASNAKEPRKFKVLAHDDPCAPQNVKCRQLHALPMVLQALDRLHIEHSDRAHDPTIKDKAWVREVMELIGANDLDDSPGGQLRRVTQEVEAVRPQPGVLVDILEFIAPCAKRGTAYGDFPASESDPCVAKLSSSPVATFAAGARYLLKRKAPHLPVYYTNWAAGCTRYIGPDGKEHCQIWETDAEMKLLTTAIFTLRAWLRDIQLGVRVASCIVMGGALATQVLECPWFKGITQFHAVTRAALQWRDAGIAAIRPPAYIMPYAGAIMGTAGKKTSYGPYKVLLARAAAYTMGIAAGLLGGGPMDADCAALAAELRQHPLLRQRLLCEGLELPNLEAILALTEPVPARPPTFRDKSLEKGFADGEVDPEWLAWSCACGWQPTSLRFNSKGLLGRNENTKERRIESFKGIPYCHNCAQALWQGKQRTPEMEQRLAARLNLKAGDLFYCHQCHFHGTMVRVQKTSSSAYRCKDDQGTLRDIRCDLLDIHPRVCDACSKAASRGNVRTPEDEVNSRLTKEAQALLGKGPMPCNLPGCNRIVTANDRVPALIVKGTSRHICGAHVQTHLLKKAGMSVDDAHIKYKKAMDEAVHQATKFSSYFKTARKDHKPAQGKENSMPERRQKSAKPE